MSYLKADLDLKYRYRVTKRNGKSIGLHRVIMMHKLGRDIQSDEIVHHINGNRYDNRPDNLTLLKQSEHARYHMTGRIVSDKTRQKESEISKARWKSGQCDALKHPVQAFDKKSGELVRTYQSMASAISDGHDHRSISKCCRGLLKSYHGLVWKLI